jgi:hypothetical protein
MGAKIFCKCGKSASECTYMRISERGCEIVGLLIYSDTDAICAYVNKFNERSNKWISSRFCEHIHLCCGSDMTVGLLALSYHDIFGSISKEHIRNSAMYNKNADEIKARIVNIAYQKIPFVFSLAKEVRYIYGSSSEPKIHTELSWSLVGRKQYGKRDNCGLLPLLYDLFQEHPNRKILLQVTVPDGSISNNGRLYRYWDIKFHISSCGKVERGESHTKALIRETLEEIDLIIDPEINKLYKSVDDGINMFYCKLDTFTCANYFAKEEAQWQNYLFCKKCRTRYYSHKSSTPTFL